MMQMIIYNKGKNDIRSTHACTHDRVITTFISLPLTPLHKIDLIMILYKEYSRCTASRLY